jgi:hypothetical protein
MTPFCIIYQNPCLSFFLKTRTHNTLSSQRILVFKISNIFVIFKKTEKVIQEEGVRGEKKVMPTLPSP